MSADAAPAVMEGFYGKLPARGDFVRAGVPRSFTLAWDAWLQRVIPASQAWLGAAWSETWMAAPLWRFALPPGACGPEATLGLWLPSMDRVGRHFPLAFVRRAADPDTLLRCGAAFLAAAERTGRAAIDTGLPPEAVVRQLPALDLQNGPALQREEPERLGLPDLPPGSALWWTDGTIRRPAMTLRLPGLPDAATFMTMLDACATGQP